MQSPSTIGAAALALLVLGASPALATSFRTFVSGHGNDAGACSVTSPCRSFAYAITQTSPSGEIAVLDTAGYGAVTITKAISIVNPGGVEAGISVGSGATAITINAGANDKVALRGLSLEGNGVGQHGIVFNSGASLDLADTVVRDFASDGIFIGSQSNNYEHLMMRNVVSNDNNGSGIVIKNNNSNYYSTLNRVFGDHNGVSGIVNNTPFGFTQVVSSEFAGNTSYDVDVEQYGIVFSQLSAYNINIGSATSVGFTNSTIEQVFNQGSCYSYGNNAILFGVSGTACSGASPSVKMQTRP